MDQGHARPLIERVRIAASFYAIVFLGIGGGAGGVLLPAQMTDYRVDKSTIGLLFVSFAAGYIACAAANGALIHRLGIRLHLIAGSVIVVVAMSAIAVRPGFWALVTLQAVVGFGIGALDAGLNSYLSTLPGSIGLLNYFHAFYGVGALIGPVVVAAMLERGFTWYAFYVVQVAVLVPLVVWFGWYPRVVRGAETVEVGPRLTIALRSGVVWVAAAFLCLYVGIEAGMGNWGFSFLTEERGRGVLAAGWIVSAYWLGLTVGRFVVNAAAQRAGVGVIAMSAVCVAGVGLSALVVWVVPSAVAATVGMVTLGFFLGPLFPTVIAVMPRLVPANLVATAIGVLIAMSILGGAVFPWIVGAAAQRLGLWTLLPIIIALTALMGLSWWRIAGRLAPSDRAEDLVVTGTDAPC